jgi:hypothetical protein
LLYLAPLAAGLTGLLFMIKPIFAPSMKPQPTHVLTRSAQPLLHAYVGRLCRAIGTPAPREIHVDMQGNASASLRRGVRSFFANDLVLTIGMPLVAGLNVSQPSAILAHEFGHFGQAVAMRFSYVIQIVNSWFARVVCERDEWDIELESAGQESVLWWFQIIVLVSKFFVWLSRRALWLLMHLGHGMSCFLSRQMEYHAAAHETQIIGSPGYRETYLQTGLLHAATELAVAHAEETRSEGRLPRNLPALVAVHAEYLERDDEIRKQMTQGILESRTRIFDTHPSDADRVRHAENMGVPPTISCRDPASALFRDFDGLAELATRTFYRLSPPRRSRRSSRVWPPAAKPWLPCCSEVRFCGSASLR